MPDQTHTPDGVDVSIVLPVFNELGHLEEEIERIRKTMDESDYSYEIVVSMTVPPMDRGNV